MEGNVVVYQDAIRAGWDLRSAAPVDMLPG